MNVETTVEMQRSLIQWTVWEFQFPKQRQQQHNPEVSVIRIHQGQLMSPSPPSGSNRATLNNMEVVVFHQEDSFMYAVYWSNSSQRRTVD